jgi:exopolysaccharide production protein ExoZ
MRRSRWRSERRTAVSERALPGGERLDALQALRAIAAGMVVFAHALGAWGHREGVRPPDRSLEVVGSLGVKVFFVISGFIITMSVSRMPVAGGFAATRLFLRRRVIRVVPLYWLATGAAIVQTSVHGAAPSLAETARSVAFIPYKSDPVLIPGWTLNYEMFFYVGVAVVLLLSVRSRYVALLAAFGALMLLRQAGVLAPGRLDVVYQWADPLLVFFLAGVTLALARDRVRARLPFTLSLPGVLLVVLAVVAGYAVAARAGLHHAESVWMVLPIATVCVAVCVLPHIPARTHRRLRTGLVRAGDGSYSTYLTHTLVLGAGGHLLATVHLAGHDIPFALGQVVVCTIAGVTLSAAVERPLTRRLNARGVRATSAAAPQPRRRSPPAPGRHRRRPAARRPTSARPRMTSPHSPPP